jgi:cell shape-determining protein MreC
MRAGHTWGKETGIPGGIVFLWFLLGGLIFFFAPRSLTSELQLGFARIFLRPLRIIKSLPVSAQGGEGSGDVVSRQRYEKLHNRLANVTEWLRQERQKVEGLSGLRDRPVWKGVDFVVADIIKASVDVLEGELIISRGREDGLARGQFVLGDESIVGTLCDVSSRTARVRLITDPSSRLAVTIGELNIAVVMQGSGNGAAGISLLSTKHKVRVNDVVCVRKKPGLLGVPMIAGTISRCRTSEESPLLWEIKVKPACEISRLTRVTVIVMNPAEENTK